MPHFIPLFVTTQVRNCKPWTKLVNNFVNTFFAKALLCEMGESLEKLEGREKQAMGKDVFKARAKEADTTKNAGKKANEKKKRADENNKY